MRARQFSKLRLDRWRARPLFLVLSLPVDLFPDQAPGDAVPRLVDTVFQRRRVGHVRCLGFGLVDARPPAAESEVLDQTVVDRAVVVHHQQCLGDPVDQGCEGAAVADPRQVARCPPQGFELFRQRAAELGLFEQGDSEIEQRDVAVGCEVARLAVVRDGLLEIAQGAMRVAHSI